MPLTHIPPVSLTPSLQPHFSRTQCLWHSVHNNHEKLWVQERWWRPALCQQYSLCILRVKDRGGNVPAVFVLDHKCIFFENCNCSRSSKFHRSQKLLFLGDLKGGGCLPQLVRQFMRCTIVRRGSFTLSLSLCVIVQNTGALFPLLPSLVLTYWASLWTPPVKFFCLKLCIRHSAILRENANGAFGHPHHHHYLFFTYPVAILQLLCSFYH